MSKNKIVTRDLPQHPRNKKKKSEAAPWRNPRTGYFMTKRGSTKYLHRHVYENAFGRLPDGWHVHHLDCDPRNNQLSNLMALPSAVHNRLHKLMREADEVFDRDFIQSFLDDYLRLRAPLQVEYDLAAETVSKLELELLEEKRNLALIQCDLVTFAPW